MGGATDVQSGRISEDPPGGDGGGDEHPGGGVGVWTTPGHGAKVAGLFRAAGSPATHSGPQAQPLDKLGRSPTPASSTGFRRTGLRHPKKQRHTAKRIFERLRDEYGFDGEYTTVKGYVREHRRPTCEMFVPVSHASGHAQCDFGEALVIIGGAEQKAHYLILDLPHSDGCFVKAYPAETTEAFLGGHISAFAFLGGVPQSVLYDKTKLAVARILGDSAPAP